MWHRSWLVGLSVVAACDLPSERFYANPKCPNLHFTLSSEAPLDTGPVPYAVVAEDVDNNSRPDLIVVNNGNGTVSVLRNQGNGTFAAKQDYKTCNDDSGCAAMFPQALHVGAIDMGMSPDIVVVNTAKRPSSGSLAILLNSGDGTFQSNATMCPALGNPTSIAAPHLDTMGGSDLVIAELNTMGKIGVLKNDGHGAFPQRVDVTAALNGGAIAVAAGDLDNDGDQDVAVVDRDSNAVSVLLGKGDGSLPTSTTYTVTGIRPTALAIESLNVDQDNARDIAVVNEKDGTVSVLLNNGDGTFPADKTEAKPYPTGTDPQSIVAVDLDHDDRADLVVANRGDNTVSVLLAVGDGTFWPTKTFPTSGLAPQSVAVADINGDGQLDLVVANSGSNTLTILLGRCDP